VIAVLTMLVLPTLVFPISTNLISQTFMCVQEGILRSGRGLRKIQSQCKRHYDRSTITPWQFFVCISQAFAMPIH
jgi:hypothetical protein